MSRARKEQEQEYYWMAEEPIEVLSGKIRLRYFSKAKKLQVSKIYFNCVDEIRIDKTVVLDYETMRQDDMKALKLLQTVINDYCGRSGNCD